MILYAFVFFCIFLYIFICFYLSLSADSSSVRISAILT